LTALHFSYTICSGFLLYVYRQASGQAIEVVVATWQDYGSDFIHLKPKLEAKLYIIAKRAILKEYLRAILAR